MQRSCFCAVIVVLHMAGFSAALPTSESECNAVIIFGTVIIFLCRDHDFVKGWVLCCGARHVFSIAHQQT